MMVMLVITAIMAIIILVTGDHNDDDLTLLWEQAAMVSAGPRTPSARAKTSILPFRGSRGSA
jgi:hypothetical protein